ncbi:CpsD/CapB family tyrosine-protein kinase [Evansella sp. AB-rgal1]|uniref:CpsD/CapB family tyrosine-protein kinase n=1 Tax=Evansella sp. AB-rgal1 TaxID=3242696 RepID=UPI00359E1F06
MVLKRKNKEHLTEKQRSLITHFEPKSPISEQYRTLRSNIQFAGLENEMRLITVTSTLPGEGKSTTAANLAIVLAQQEHNVLLIDADMRKPTNHYTFQLDNHTGLTKILTQNVPLGDVTQESAILGLDVLTCGPIPPNPAELLSMKRMDWLLQEAKKQYDYVILDTPPILPVTDGQILANKSDGVLLVVSSGKTGIEGAKKAKELLEQAKGKLLGVVLNGKDKKNSNYYYYYGENSDK